jgi:hypothetical protein
MLMVVPFAVEAQAAVKVSQGANKLRKGAEIAELLRTASSRATLRPVAIV